MAYKTVVGFVCHCQQTSRMAARQSGNQRLLSTIAIMMAESSISA
ncbi:hypothetical protein [Xenorhabdus anantnagensis]|uniref:Transposase n=1 Tax=Xenorhabdus anantnagensis TaxID=3025875 RepID=A0ABT5LU73_9GAMM|nr:hypothetical protein [Xenorhabdus anantnagensis]MDC9597967.1 hypothetical protein [Xenorhabdus anantnagensis]